MFIIAAYNFIISIVKWIKNNKLWYINIMEYFPANKQKYKQTDTWKNMN